MKILALNGGAHLYRVLLVVANPQETGPCSELIGEVAHCKIDCIELKGAPFRSAALELAARTHYHLIVISECDSSLLLLEKIKRLSPRSSVILISREPTVEEAVAAIRMGAEDYLNKSFAADSFRSSVKRCLEKNIVPMELPYLPNFDPSLSIGQLLFVDDATGLFNTRYLNTILDKEIAHAQATQRSFAVLFVDADRFKSINDQYGHLVGTQLLHQLGSHLKECVRKHDRVFRYGGDEFVAVLSPCDLATARSVAERIRESIGNAVFMETEGLNIRFTVCIGIALFPDHARSKQEIIDAADRAMYSAKRMTRNSVLIAETQMPILKGVL